MFEFQGAEGRLPLRIRPSSLTRSSTTREAAIWGFGPTLGHSRWQESTTDRLGVSSMTVACGGRIADFHSLLNRNPAPSWTSSPYSGMIRVVLPTGQATRLRNFFQHGHSQHASFDCTRAARVRAFIFVPFSTGLDPNEVFALKALKHSGSQLYWATVSWLEIENLRVDGKECWQ